MAIQTQVVYPNTTSFTGTGQLNEGPFFVPAVHTLLRAEVRGQVNLQFQAITATSVNANWQLWALQWVPHGSVAQDVVTTADGPSWLIREQIGKTDYASSWAPSTATGVVTVGFGMKAEWAGQLAINADIDFYLSLRAPTGASIPNFNLFGSIRYWWA